MNDLGLYKERENMTKSIYIVNQGGLSRDEMALIVTHSQEYANLVVKEWSLGPVVVSEQPSVPIALLNAESLYLFITNNKAQLGISGYHGVTGSGVTKSSVIYCRPGTAKNRFGTYRPGRTWRGKVYWLESFRPGLLTVMCHEIAEALIDPFDDLYSNPDSKDRRWYMEIGDHVFGSYFVDLNHFVYPDFALPSFYNIKGIAPFTHLNAVNAPFTMTPKGYGSYMAPTTGKVTKF